MKKVAVGALLSVAGLSLTACFPFDGLLNSAPVANSLVHGSSQAVAGSADKVQGSVDKASGSVDELTGSSTHDNAPAQWKLLHEETFDRDLGVQDQAWVVDTHGDDSPWNVDEFDDDGAYFQNLGGEHFQRALDSVSIMRKRVETGTDGWLTVEAAAQDRDKDGQPDAVPQLKVANGAATIDIPRNDTALLLTSTKPLPQQYRIEVELKGLDFGGKKDGSWHYDGKYNGHKEDEDCTTNFPWVRKGDYSQGGADEVDPCAKPWGDTKQENGYYLLEILDHAKPAPHNNIFIHSHRKVGMDIYSVDAGWAKNYKVCNPKTKELEDYPSSDGHGINEIFFDGNSFRDPSFAYNQFVMGTECGTRVGDVADATIVSAAEVMPEVMPDETYTFAIERTDHSYVQEMTGNFKNIGYKTLRYERPFISDDGHSIWHYNQTPEEYDGHLNQKLTFEGPFGSFEKDMWPEGSAYPDNFAIGIPHLNYYSGTATIDNLRLYTK